MNRLLKLRDDWNHPLPELRALNRELIRLKTERVLITLGTFLVCTLLITGTLTFLSWHFKRWTEAQNRYRECLTGSADACLTAATDTFLMEGQMMEAARRVPVRTEEKAK